MRLRGVHPDLVQVIECAIEITSVDFTVLEGVRTMERQKHLVDIGASKTMNSRHLNALTLRPIHQGAAEFWGHAVDIAPWVNRRISWHWPHYHELAPHIKQAAIEVGVPVEWGGDWTRFVDGPHWQLPRGVY